MGDPACNQHSARPQISLELSGAALHRALGRAGLPATLTFTFNALVVTTPSGSVRIAARTVVSAAAGAQTAGLRPRDADILREATDRQDTTISLTANALTLTLSHTGSTVTTGRW